MIVGGQTTIEHVAEHDLVDIVKTAHDIWHQHYPGIISIAQIDYMLANRYTVDVLLHEIREENIRYLRAVNLDGTTAGYAAWGPGKSSDEAKLHKLYLRVESRGQGVGKKMMNQIESEATEHGYSVLVLNVNKENIGSIAAYKKSGFTIREAVVIDIGGGFVMDDYIMEKRLA